MIRLLYCPHGKAKPVEAPVEKLPALLQDERGLVWLDLEDEPDERCEEILRDIFHFHPLAIDDTLHEVNVPKLDDWGDYLYLALDGVTYDGEAMIMVELDAFLGRNYLVTYHRNGSPAVERVWESLAEDERLQSHGPDRLFYRVADELLTDYLTVLEQLEESLTQLEDRIFRHPDRNALGEIFILKRRLLQMRRLVVPQREVINKLARDEFDVIDPEDQIFFRDLYDHMLRLYDLMESLREMVSGTLEIYLSVINNRMNDVMKTLTVITTFFMPLTFITGFFGMNFFGPVLDSSAWTGRLALIITLAVMIFAPMVMLWWMRRRGWM